MRNAKTTKISKTVSKMLELGPFTSSTVSKFVESISPLTGYVMSETV